METTQRPRLWKDAWKLMGPAFLVSVAYLDPGNWATAIEGGSRYGYDLLWIVVLSYLIAILLQTLAARLGLVTGCHLAQICRQEYPQPVCWTLWVLAEMSIVALDLTMVLGTAIGLNLLFRLPLTHCIFLTSLDALVLFLLLPRMGGNRAEIVTVVLMGAVMTCILVDLFICKPPVKAVVKGLLPSLHMDSMYISVSMLGANIMPHNFYLHSALVTRQASERKQRLPTLCWYNFIDIACALTFALLINATVLIVAAATFNSAGEIVLTLQDAHDMMERILSSSVAPAAFGVALVCAGQLSTFTGTIAGQVILKGFLNMKLSTWVRRLVTRSLAIVPALALQMTYGDEATYKLLVMMQVVLSLQLPCTLVPLIQATSCRKLMGDYVNSNLLKWAAWGCSTLICVANVLLFVELVYPHNWSSSGKSLWNYAVQESTEMAVKQPLQFNCIIALGVVLALTIALLLYMFSNPVSGKGVEHKKMARATSDKQIDPNLAYHFFVRTSCGKIDTACLIFEPPSMCMDAPHDSKVVLLAPPVAQINENGKEEDDSDSAALEMDDWEALADEIMHYVQRPAPGESSSGEAQPSAGDNHYSELTQQESSSLPTEQKESHTSVSTILATAGTRDMDPGVHEVGVAAQAGTTADAQDSSRKGDAMQYKAGTTSSGCDSNHGNDPAAVHTNSEAVVERSAATTSSLVHPSADRVRRRKGTSSQISQYDTMLEGRKQMAAETSCSYAQNLNEPKQQRSDNNVPKIAETTKVAATTTPETYATTQLKHSTCHAAKTTSAAESQNRDQRTNVQPSDYLTIPESSAASGSRPGALPPRAPPAIKPTVIDDVPSGRHSVDLSSETRVEAVPTDAIGRVDTRNPRARFLGRSLSGNLLQRNQPCQLVAQRHYPSSMDPLLQASQAIVSSPISLSARSGAVSPMFDNVAFNSLSRSEGLAAFNCDSHNNVATVSQLNTMMQQTESLWAADNLATNLESYLQPGRTIGNGLRPSTTGLGQQSIPNNNVLNPTVQSYVQSRVENVLQARANGIAASPPDPLSWDTHSVPVSSAWQDQNIGLAAHRMSAALSGSLGNQQMGGRPVGATAPTVSGNLLSSLSSMPEQLLSAQSMGSASGYDVNGNPIMAVPYHLQQQLGALGQPILSVPPLERLQQFMATQYGTPLALPGVPRPPSVYEDLLNIPPTDTARYDAQLNVTTNSVVNHILQGIATNEQAAQVLTSDSSSATPQSIHCSGMSKGSRREFATLLDKFWSEHFDLHGSAITRGGGKRSRGLVGVNRDSVGDWTPWGNNSSRGQIMAAKQMALEIHQTVTDCVNELAVLKGSEWLFEVYFPTSGGIRDHEKRVTIQLRQFFDALNASGTTLGELPGHRDDVSMLYSFGIWCIVRVMQLCQAEPRPELWGKYAFVLNRLQGVLSLIPRSSVTAVEVSATVQLAQAAIQGKRGPAGTAAGDVAFPKGKEIIISVFKRYRRTLQGQAWEGSLSGHTQAAGGYTPHTQHQQQGSRTHRRGARSQQMY